MLSVTRKETMMMSRPLWSVVVVQQAPRGVGEAAGFDADVDP